MFYYKVKDVIIIDMNLCTLFDSNYIDRALVMYDSLVNICDRFNLYVVAFDSKCYNALVALNLPHLYVVSYDEFEDDTLKVVQANRSRREFLWTCSGYSIRYLINRFDLPNLTYIDSDLYFYKTPENALRGFLNSDCDVALTPHNYSKHLENTIVEKKCGKYCVEFNSFKNTPNGMHILNWWIDKCLESCPEIPTDEAFGDQKYLDEFDKRFDGIYVYNDFRMGIAPWNVDDYVLSEHTTGKEVIIKNKHTDEAGSLVYYHFHSLEVYPDKGANIRVFIRPGHHDRNLVELLYKPYIRSILEKRKLLNERFCMFDRSTQSDNHRLHEGELKSFLTSEPNLWFLIRKIWRYLLYKRYDYIRVN